MKSILGKIGRIRVARPRFGIRGSLFAAFAVIAGMAILISVGAGAMLGQLGQMMTELNGRDIPKLTASLELATASESLASQGPMLLASSSGACGPPIRSPSRNSPRLPGSGPTRPWSQRSANP
ncbi:MAG: hypothetical protein EON84_13305 [Bradyrhizobiaceae bacterium]|nr:MAG: hypothetical protein EON84_13305 [Bradyrhizobiaceae bacterium]